MFNFCVNVSEVNTALFYRYEVQKIAVSTKSLLKLSQTAVNAVAALCLFFPVLQLQLLCSITHGLQLLQFASFSPLVTDEREIRQQC